jgi:phosphoglycolate phosphatase-like HAD superfamily hydrolase
MQDCALFDVDGVLVDIRKSYNAAIKKTVDFMLGQQQQKLLQSGKKRTALRGLVTDEIILRFRQSGGFNNDADTTYAITLATLSRPPTSTADGRRFLLSVAQNADETGIASVEKFLAPYGIEKWKEALGYPAPVRECALARAFDEFFYGPELFEKQNNLEAKYWWMEGSSSRRPLIKNDILAVTPATMRQLHKVFDGNLAMVTGRSRLAAEYSLRSIMKYFDLDACVFLEDEKREYAKPNPYAIKKAMEVMHVNTAVYAGDSAEDLMMARRAEKETGAWISFVGIYGYSSQPSKTLENFKKMGVEAVATTVNRLPGLLKKKNGL